MVAVSCQISPSTGKGAVTVLGSGIVNDPANKSLRFDLLEFALDEFCRHLLVSGAPLRLADDQPIIGRFFGDGCQAKSIDQYAEHTIIVQFDGVGYAWTLGTGRIGFRARGLLELEPDFRVHQDSMYVYFRPVQVDTSAFEVLMTERKFAQTVVQAIGVQEREIGKAIVDAQLGRGFTVVRYDADGHTDFALGLIDRGKTPFRPYQVLASPQHTLANGRTEIFVGQQDYLGKIRVAEEEAVTLTIAIEGAPYIDVALVPVGQGDDSIVKRFVNDPGPQAPRRSVPFKAQVTRAAPLKAQLDVGPGDYYLLFDHSSEFGQSSPTEETLPARVDYLVQVGNRGR